MQENIYPSNNLPIKIIADNNEGINFYPTPLSDQDLVEPGGYIEPEESKDDLEAPGESASSDGIIEEPSSGSLRQKRTPLDASRQRGKEVQLSWNYSGSGPQQTLRQW